MVTTIIFGNAISYTSNLNNPRHVYEAMHTCDTFVMTTTTQPRFRARCLAPPLCISSLYVHTVQRLPKRVDAPSPVTRLHAPWCFATQTPPRVACNSICTVREHAQHDATTTCPDDAAPTNQGNVTMRFELHCAPPPPPGSRMLLLGSAHALGSWDVRKAVHLQYVKRGGGETTILCSSYSCMDNNWWSTPHLLHLPAGALLEYKYAIVTPGSHELRWQGGINESVQLPHDSEGRVWILKDEWDCSDHVLLTGAYESDAVECVLVRAVIPCYFLFVLNLPPQNEGQVPAMAHIPVACLLCGHCATPQRYAATCPRLHRPGFIT